MTHTDESIVAIENEQTQYFFFKSGGDSYAIEALHVKEMIEYQSYTKVPLMNACIKGVTNVRGEIIAVIDLLERLNLGSSRISKKSTLVIINSIALIIDEISEVNALDEIDIKESLDFGSKIEKRFIKNMAKYEDDYIVILDIEEVLRIKELAKVEVHYE